MDELNERREFRDLVVRPWGALLKWLALLVVGIAIVVILVSLGGDDGFGQLDADNPTRSYFLVFLLVAADAVIPIFPGETTLNAASTLAADGDLELWLVIVLGALGALVGDSTLYWIAGLRFVINATMGMNRYPYGKYLPWSALGAAMWSTYTCVLAYKVGSSLDNYPLASVYISGLITTVLMAVIFLVVRRRDKRSAETEPAGGVPSPE